MTRVPRFVGFAAILVGLVSCSKTTSTSGSVQPVVKQAEGPAAVTPSTKPAPKSNEEPLFKGKPLSTWVVQLKDLDPETQNEAVSALAKFKDDEIKTAVPLLIEILKEKPPVISFRVDDTARILEKTRIAVTHIQAARLLGRARAEEAIPQLTTMAEWKVLDVDLAGVSRAQGDTFLNIFGLEMEGKESACSALALIGNSARSELESLAGSKDNQTKKYAKVALAKLDGKAAPSIPRGRPPEIEIADFVQIGGLSIPMPAGASLSGDESTTDRYLTAEKQNIRSFYEYAMSKEGWQKAGDSCWHTSTTSFKNPNNTFCLMLSDPSHGSLSVLARRY